MCAGALDLSVFEELKVELSSEQVALAKELGLHGPDFATYVDSGLLACSVCQLDFPVYKGLPVMLPYTTRLHEEFEQEFDARLRERRPHRYSNREPVQGERFVLSSFSTEWLAYDFDGVIWEMDYADHERRFLAELGPFALKPRQRGTFMELGCGIGITTHLAQKNFDVDAVGVDLSLASMRAALRYRENPFLHFVQGSVFYLPFREATFDVIYSRGVLHHTYSTSKAFASLARYAKPGGATYLWVYGPKSINDNLLRRSLHTAERAVRKLLSGRDSGVLANMILWPLAGAYVVFNHARRLADPTIQPYNFQRARHAARDRFTPEFAHRHSSDEVLDWFRRAGYADLEVVDWKAMPTADHDDYRRNTGVRGRKLAREGRSDRPIGAEAVAADRV
jgi:ubiquinone/menaquinone biosynthesis C-methylase UbiE/uncharacterized protein YbaR (Trm112 family)